MPPPSAGASGDGDRAVIRAGLWWRAARPAQWTKNAAVLAPVFFAAGDPDQAHGIGFWIRSFGAAGLFCLLSSAVYLANDVCDRDADRVHPFKRLRPVASGDLPVREALLVAAVLLTAGLSGACWLGFSFFAVAFAYVLLQGLYSRGLKRVAGLDVLMVASGFVLRALAGGIAATVDVSPWLMLCAFLLALFLALCKRRAEAQAAGGRARGYSVAVLDQLVGIAAGGAVISYALYALSFETFLKFGTRNLIYTLPFVIYGVFRYLLRSAEDGAGEEPERLLLTDRPTWINLVLYAGTVLTIIALRP